MEKKFAKLTKTTFDLAVVGGGIHGATIACAAARSGYRVALLEQGDFGGATSANSLKIIHGGIRYLQHGDIRRMRESIVSRREMMVFAPHLVKPLACLMPTYGHGLKGRETMRLAFALYDLIAWDRNCGLTEENRLACGTWITPAEVRWAVPGVRPEGLTGGAVWYDAIASDTERLTLEYIKEAVRYGAVASNYTKALDLQFGGGRVYGVVARDLQDNRELAVASRLVVNAAGPWLGRLPGDGSALSHQLWATAVNLVVKKKLFHHYAVGLEGYTEFTDKDALIKRGKRLFFFVPWQSDYTMIGTTYTPYRGSSDDFALTRDDLGKILWDINQIYPQGKLVPADVSFFHGGLLPITEADDRVADSVQLDKSSTIIDHGPIDGREGLLSIKGVKYTTAPSIARKVVRLLNGDRWLGRPPAPVYQVPRPGMVDFGRVIARLGSAYADLRRLLSERYGAAWREVFALVAEQMAESEGATFPPTVSEQPLLLVAEVRYFLREEMAATVADVVFRRSNLAAAECPPRPVLARIAAIVGRERGLTDDELARQVTEVEAVFAILQPQENNSVS